LVNDQVIEVKRYFCPVSQVIYTNCFVNYQYTNKLSSKSDDDNDRDNENESVSREFDPHQRLPLFSQSN